MDENDLNLVGVNPLIHLNGIKAILTTSTISNLAVFVMIWWIITQKHSRHTVVTRLVLNLITSDFIQSIGFMMSFNWLRIRIITPGTYCDVQGFLINLGDVASGFWALVICLHTYMLVVHSYEYPHMVFLAMIMIWPFNIIISGLGFVIQQGYGTRFYDDAGGSWCWISPKYPNFRIGFHYGIILFNAASMIVLYAIMFAVIYRRQGSMATQGSKKVLQSVNKKLVWYPIVYIVLVFPLALQRIVAIAINSPNIWGIDYLIPAACIFTSAGLVNTIIYGITRNIVSIKPMMARLKRLTTSSIPSSSSESTTMTNTNLHNSSLQKSGEFFSTIITGGTGSEVDPMSSFISITTTQQVRISYLDPPAVPDVDADDNQMQTFTSVITPPSPTYSSDPLKQQLHHS
ncbi:G protein-coupled glucose receptor regulating Gpa2-domain-containing protein [Glomus cerebriforme]|uniref:G protein-coupled glucose receptor regulating Gpa2-domain-containing protein n=1 Tax=Glomus cerebriforme TaxID=658196 RepID=A0A397SEL6_9GLOM|nr:G protein-coupled glucose receptor regulating Gpa2-domain-containing protein [Glomus cerebriforme]